MESQTLIFVLAAIMFVAVAAFGYIPLGLGLSSVRLKQFTAIGAGILIGSAFLVIIPEGLEILEDQQCNKLMAPYQGRMPSEGMGENANLEKPSFL